VPTESDNEPSPVKNTVTEPLADGTTPVQNWDEIIRIIKNTCPIMGGVLNDSSAFIKGQYLLIDAPNSQFRSLINSGNSFYKDSIRKAAFQVLGETYKLGPYAKTNAVSDGDDPLKAIAEKLKNFEVN